MRKENTPEFLKGTKSHRICTQPTHNLSTKAFRCLPSSSICVSLRFPVSHTPTHIHVSIHLCAVGSCSCSSCFRTPHRPTQTAPTPPTPPPTAAARRKGRRGRSTRRKTRRRRKGSGSTSPPKPAAAQIQTELLDLSDVLVGSSPRVHHRKSGVAA